jgi:hypothetical protein
MSSRWTTEPVTIGVVTRYLVRRKDRSENRGIWDTEQEAQDLAERLNFLEFGDNEVEDDVDFDE